MKRSFTVLSAYAALMVVPAAAHGQEARGNAPVGRPAALVRPTLSGPDRPDASMFIRQSYTLPNFAGREPFMPLVDATPVVAAAVRDTNTISMASVEVLGLVIGRTQTFALLKAQNGSVIRVQPGQVAGDFRVTSITSSAVTVTSLAGGVPPVRLPMSRPVSDPTP